MAIEVQTTETIAQLVAAKNAEAPANSEPAKEVAQQPDTVTPTQEVEKDVKAEGEETGEKTRKNPVQKRIDEITRKSKENEELARDEYNRRILAERRAQELEEQLSKLKPQEVVEEKKKPVASDYKNVEEYVEALSDWKAEQRDKQKEAERQKQLAQEAEAARIQAWQERQEKARTEMEDYDEVVGKADLPIRTYLQEAIVESEYGPHLAYHLAQNPKELERLNKLTPASAIRELGKLETKFEKQAAKAESTEEVDTSKRVASPPVSRAPAPIEPVRSVSAPQVSKDPSTMSFEEYRAARKAGKVR